MAPHRDACFAPGLDGQMIRDYETFRALRADWNDLLGRSNATSAWFTHEWLDCWWRAFGDDARMFIPTVRQEGRLVAAAPMMIVQARIKGIKCKVLRFMENGITPRSQFLVAPAAGDNDGDGMKALWHLIKASASEWDLAILANVAEEDLRFAAWQDALADAGLHAVQTPDRRSPFIDLSDGYQAFRLTLSPKLRENINASRNRLSKLGTVDIRAFLGTDETPEALETCYAVSARSWKAGVGSDLGARSDYRSFYHSVTQEETLRERLYVWILAVDDRPVAFNMVVRSEEGVCGLATDYDLEFKRCSPGVYLFSQVLERLSALGVTRCDMAGELYDYKLFWTKQYLPHSQFWVFHPGARSRLLRRGKILADVLRSRLEKTEPA